MKMLNRTKIYQCLAVLALTGGVHSAVVHAELETVKPDPNKQHQHQLPVFEQTVGFNLPKGWKQAYHEQQAGMFTAEFIPEQEALTHWSSLFCVQGFKGLADSVEPEQFLDSMAETYKHSCQGEVIYQKLGSTDVDGLDAYHGILGCTKMPDQHKADIVNKEAYRSTPQGEIGHYTVVSGSKDVYLLHKSMRGDVFAADAPPLKADNHDAFIAAMVPFNVR